jgi:hypothetical protein
MRTGGQPHLIVERDGYGGQDPERVVEPKLMMVIGFHEMNLHCNI